eukprot:TRINITY_DN33652_c0_g1_i1.p1 TRINITY_DN33652_c0_g1~~TRINITY_DN33652_c0_g1_i1.p1  ORF type:complete len:360 (+),score=87.42 TRINITY_DN33652_c0_g1_i1:118-1197(+)
MGRHRQAAVVLCAAVTASAPQHVRGILYDEGHHLGSVADLKLGAAQRSFEELHHALARHARESWPGSAFDADPFSYFHNMRAAVNRGFDSAFFNGAGSMGGGLFEAPLQERPPILPFVHGLAQGIGDNEAMKNAAVRGNVQSFSSQTQMVMGPDGKMHTKTIECVGKNCKEKDGVESLQQANQQMGAGGQMNAAVNNDIVNNIAASMGKLSKQMQNMKADERKDFQSMMAPMAGLRQGSPTQGDNDDMSMGGMDTFGSMGGFGKFPDILGSMAKDQDGNGAMSSQEIASNSFSESKQQFVKDGKIHTVTKTCKNGKCETQESTSPLPGGAVQSVPDSSDRGKANGLAQSNEAHQLDSMF